MTKKKKAIEQGKHRGRFGSLGEEGKKGDSPSPTARRNAARKKRVTQAVSRRSTKNSPLGRKQSKDRRGTGSLTRGEGKTPETKEDSQGSEVLHTIETSRSRKSFKKKYPEKGQTDRGNHRPKGRLTKKLFRMIKGKTRSEYPGSGYRKVKKSHGTKKSVMNRPALRQI